MKDEFLTSKSKHGAFEANPETLSTKIKEQKESTPQTTSLRSVSADDSALTPTTNRREFLDKAAGVTLATLAAGLVGVPSALGATEKKFSAKKGKLEKNSELALALRRKKSYFIRLQAAANEARIKVYHPTNGDEERYPTRIGNFHKTLPHNQYGEVDPNAYNILLAAVQSGKLEDFEKVPTDGGPFARLLNPLGALAHTIFGPDSAAVPVKAAPPVASAELAAYAAELYWQAICRDIPFTDWDTDPTVAAAAKDLGENFSGYTGPRDSAGEVTPQLLFRLPYPGSLEGPMVSQFVWLPFTYDGISIQQKVRTAMAGADFLTEYNEWLAVQNGAGGGFGGTHFEPDDRYVHNVRGLGQNAAQDAIYSQYFKAALMLGFLAPVDMANPYRFGGPIQRQFGFSTFGLAHLLELIGIAPRAERHAWYTKWCVNRFLRPEAYGGLVHWAKVEGRYPIHPDLLNSEVLERIFLLNQARNAARGLGSIGTYLLPQVLTGGSPTHPSYTAGHAISAGACVTMLKAWVDEEAEWPSEPMQANADGTALEPYTGPTLTLGGELNKLCHNLSIGRDMSGVHWRADNTEGNKQGEEVAIRLLAEETAIYPEEFEGFSLTKFDGTKIIIKGGKRYDEYGFEI